MGVVAHQGPGVDRCPALRGEVAQPAHKSLRSWSSSTMRRLSIPRIITWWSVPGLSSLACRGIAYRLRLCWRSFIKLCPASQQRPVSLVPCHSPNVPYHSPNVPYHSPRSRRKTKRRGKAELESVVSYLPRATPS